MSPLQVLYSSIEAVPKLEIFYIMYYFIIFDRFEISIFGLILGSYFGLTPFYRVYWGTIVLPTDGVITYL